MKKINLIERLWTDSHEKQKVRSVRRYAAMLIMLLTLGVGQMWAYNEYWKKILYIDATACNWYTDGDCHPCLDIYDDYACNTQKAYQDAPNGSTETKIWYFDLSGFYAYWEYSRGFKVQRRNTSRWYNYVQSGYVDGDTHNCFKINSGSNGMSWTYYRPPMTSASVVDNGTTKTGSGTSVSPYQVVTGSTIYLSASCVSSVDDPSMTKEYKFYNKGSQLRAYSSTNTYSFTAGAAGTTYEITVTAQNTYQSGSGTASPASSKIYYTIIAEPEATNEVTIAYKCGATTIKSSTAEDVGVETPSSISAPDIVGYTFSSWSLGNGLNNESGSTTANPISITTKASGTYTLTANYNEDLTSTWYVLGTPTSVFAGASEWATDDDHNMLMKPSGSSTGSAGSVTFNVKALPASESSYQFKVKDATGSGTWYGWGSNGSHYHVLPNAYSLTLDGSENLYFRPDALGDYTFTVNWSSTPTLVVTFPTSYAVNFGQGSGTAGTASATYSSTSFTSGTKVQNGKSITLTAPSASTGYTWDGWYNASSGGSKVSGNNPLTTTVSSSNKDFYARYTINNHSITRTSPTNGDYTIKVGSAAAVSTNTTSNYGETITLAATPSTGYYLSEWTVTKTGDASTVVTVTNNTFTMPDYNVTVTATFAPIWRIAGGNSSSPDAMGDWSTSANQITSMTTSAGVTSGSVDISLPANTDYEFKVYNASDEHYWGYNSSVTKITYENQATAKTLADNAGNNQTFRTAAAGTYTFTWDATNSQVTIEYPTSYKVTFGYGTGGSNVTASGSTTGSIGSGDYVAPSENVTFTQTKVHSGYDFKGWYTTADGNTTVGTMGVNDNILNTIAANATVYAQYSTHTWTSVKLDKNGGSTDGAYSVTYLGTEISVTTTPAKTGYHVDGYYKQSGLTNLIATSAGALQVSTDYTNSSSQWTQTSGQTLYTKWAANTYTAANNIDGDGGSNGQYTATYDATSIAINTAPTRTGYNLTGYHAWGREANTLANTAGALSASQSENKTGGKTLTNSSSQWIYDGNDVTIYADWSPKTYSITLDREGAATGSTSVTMTYDASTHTAITNPTKTGYTFGGYWTGDNGTGSMVIATDGTLQENVSTYTGAGGIWKKDATCTLYAKWTANNYTVTLSCSGETGYGSSPSGVKESVSATYDSSMPMMGTAPTPAPGYKFMGYFLGQNGTGVQYYAADGSSLINWTTASNTTLYAYFRKTEISSLTHPAAVAKGDVVYMVVDPVFNQTGAQNYMDICWSFLYDTDTPVESGWEVESYTEGGSKPYQVRFTLTGISSGYYKIKAVLKANGSSGFDACSTGTELSTIKSNITVAGNSKVTIQYQDATTGKTLRENSTVEVARGDEIEVTAPDIIGYTFDSWVLGDVLHTDDDPDEDNPITISADYDGYLTAKYNKKNMIYFNNTLGWDTVYVYFYSTNRYWNDTYGCGASTEQSFGGDSHKPHYRGFWGGMTKITGTNVYYFDYEDSISISSWDPEIRGYHNVAFAKDAQGTPNGEYKNGYNWFDNTEVVRREDYYTSLSMYVPLNVVTDTKNSHDAVSTKYYNKGYWTNYPESTGYTLKIYDNTTSGALKKEIAFTFPADKKMPMSITTDLEAGKTYGFKIYRADGSEYGNNGTMTNGHSGDGSQGVWEFKTGKNRAGLTTTSAGDYTFTLSYGLDIQATPEYNYLVAVHYPEATGDFRVQYKDNDHTNWRTSVVIPANTESDTISYFVRKDETPYIRVQKCTATYEGGVTTVSWNNESSGANIISSLPSAITENGVYNFIFKKEDGALVLDKVEPYEGNFYIRVDGAGSSNWDNFRASDHLMPYSDYSFNQAKNPYSHYFMEWREVTDRAHLPNVKFVVANDYSVCISDTIAQDGVANSYVDANGYLNRDANIRFMYNYKTNVAKRAYVDGAYSSSNNFLVLESGDSKISIRNYNNTTDSVVSVLKFSDNGNWIYEAVVKAKPGAKYKLKSTYGAPNSSEPDENGEVVQYFKGGPNSTSADSATLIGGSGSSWYQIRLLYDFKTNRVVAAYQPSGDITENLEIHADIMFMREHQGDIEQITFAEGKSISEIENIYCGLKFNKYTLNNLNKEEPHGILYPLLSRYERDIFYVSFPYDVRLSDVIGFGTYGQHWIVEYYDGAARAKEGFWSDSESFWKFVTPAMKDTFTMKAGTGYIVALDLDEMWYINDTYHADIWNNMAEVELLFPGDVSSISNQAVTYNMPTHQCTINRGTTYGNRTKKDSHWNVLGVPTFKNITGEASGATDDGGGNAEGAIRFANTAWIKDSLNNKLKFIYDGNLSDNSLTAKAVKGFEFKAMHAYVVQYCGDVTFTTSNAPAPSPIVARRTYAEKPIDVDFRLELSTNGVMEDQTFISLSTSEDASADFVFGEDLSKEFNSNRANIYTFIGTEWAAGNTLPMSNQTTIIPVGVKTAAEGEYTFSIPEGTYGVGITLIDNGTGARTNLGLMDYTVNLSEGQIDNRFVLEISPIQQTPTDIEAVTGDGLQVTGARKVMIDGLLYIVKDGKVYDAQGKRVQ